MVDGIEIREAVITAGKIRMRPILITALTLMAGAYMILDDLIIRGMAVSLLFGAGVATVLTLVVIPLGCISVSKQFYILAGINEKDIPVASEDLQCECSPNVFWQELWNQIVSIFKMLFVMIQTALNTILSKVKNNPDDPEPTGPDSSGPSGGNPPVTPSSDGAAVINQSLHIHEETKPVVKKKSSPRKKSVPKKKTVKKVSSENKKVSTVKKTSTSKKKATTKKRRGIRLNHGLDTDK